MHFHSTVMDLDRKVPDVGSIHECQRLAHFSGYRKISDDANVLFNYGIPHCDLKKALHRALIAGLAASIDTGPSASAGGPATPTRQLATSGEPRPTSPPPPSPPR